MMDQLIALAGDLVLERKRLSEGLRKLEGALLHGDCAQAISRALGTEGTESVHAEFDRMARALDRLGALTKTLSHHVNSQRLVSFQPLLDSAAGVIEGAGERLGRPVHIEIKASDLRAERESIERFQDILLEMLDDMVEYGVEAPKERAARQKRPKAYFQLELKATEDGVRLMVLCDGNGVMPPVSRAAGVRLAKIGARAVFEGKPGQWSAWMYYLSGGTSEYRCVPIRAGGKALSLPSWAVLSTKTIAEFLAEESKVTKSYALGDSLGRFEIEPGCESGYGNYVITVAAGTQKARYVVDEIGEAEEVFMKPLPEAFSGNGRFIGAVVTGQEESASPGFTAPAELALVLNPAYLVYGEQQQQRATKGTSKEASHAG